MRRREFLPSMLAAPLAAYAQTRPNLVIILADDMGYADAGFQGCRDIPTPHLDRLAASGVRFTNAYVSHPFCSPTRAGLMTGRYQQRFGHENNPIYNPKDEIAGLPTGETTLPQMLQGAGYVTGHIGKWHLGAAPKFHPTSRGFTESFGFLGGGHDYFKAEMDGDPREYLIPIRRNAKPEPLNGYLTDVLSHEAAAFVRRHKDHPFFLYLAYNTPHTPQQAAEAYLSRFTAIADEKRRKYAAMVSAMDDGVGRLLDTLRDTGTADRTVVVFLSDNGGPVGINGSDNRPLRAGKGTVYEGGTRVPFVMRWPGALAKGAVYDRPVTSLDLFPTFTAAAGVKAKPANALDGVDLLPFVSGRKAGSPHGALFWRTGGGAAHAVREGSWKLVRHRGRAAELYDLAADGGEERDLAAAKPEVAARLKDALETWDRQLVAPLFESPRPAAKKKAV